MTARTLFSLILCNVIWSASPTLGKIVLRDLAPAHAAWLRCTVALAAYAGCARIFRDSFPGGAFVPLKLLRGGRFAWIAVLGLMTFFASPLLQSAGLDASRAIDNALIIAMEPLMAVFLAWGFLGERLERRHWISFALALLGFSLLSELTPARMLGGLDSHLRGNLILVLSIVGEAAYTVLGRKLVRKGGPTKKGTTSLEPTQVFGSALLIGVLALTLKTLAESGLPDFSEISLMAWLSLSWLGVLATVVTYVIWMRALEEAPVATLSLTLFIQPVLGALWGMFFLEERLGALQATGAMLILGAVLAQYREALGSLLRMLSLVSTRSE